LDGREDEPQVGLDVMTKRYILVPAESELGPSTLLPINLMKKISQLSFPRNVFKRATFIFYCTLCRRILAENNFVGHCLIKLQDKR
jgi:hypothetical protein